jgi:hypothetical protein
MECEISDTASQETTCVDDLKELTTPSANWYRYTSVFAELVTTQSFNQDPVTGFHINRYVWSNIMANCKQFDAASYPRPMHAKIRWQDFETSLLLHLTVSEDILRFTACLLSFTPEATMTH